MKFLVTLSVLFLSLYSTAQNDIFEAIRQGDSNPVQDILRYDATAANSINSIGYSPLIVAAYSGKKEIVSLLIAFGADVNFDTDNGDALMAAVKNNHTEIVEILLTNSANPNESDLRGKSPLLIAVLNENVAIVDLLMKTGADQFQKDDLGTSAFDYAKDNKLKEILDIFKKYQ
jgi:ankyrin repeat protein